MTTLLRNGTVTEKCTNETESHVRVDNFCGIGDWVDRRAGSHIIGHGGNGVVTRQTVSDRCSYHGFCWGSGGWDSDAVGFSDNPAIQNTFHCVKSRQSMSRLCGVEIATKTVVVSDDQFDGDVPHEWHINSSVSGEPGVARCIYKGTTTVERCSELMTLTNKLGPVVSSTMSSALLHHLRMGDTEHKRAEQERERTGPEKRYATCDVFEVVRGQVMMDLVTEYIPGVTLMRFVCYDHLPIREVSDLTDDEDEVSSDTDQPLRGRHAVHECHCKQERECHARSLKQETSQRVGGHPQSMGGVHGSGGGGVAGSPQRIGYAIRYDVFRGVLEGLCLSLERVHAKGIAHWDVKPANILLTPTGTTVLCDWGSAALCDGTGIVLPTKRMSDAQYTYTTRIYVAPEQVLVVGRGSDNAASGVASGGDVDDEVVSHKRHKTTAGPHRHRHTDAGSSATAAASAPVPAPAPAPARRPIIGTAVDMWSLGLVLIEILIGRGVYNCMWSVGSNSKMSTYMIMFLHTVMQFTRHDLFRVFGVTRSYCISLQEIHPAVHLHFVCIREHLNQRILRAGHGDPERVWTLLHGLLNPDRLLRWSAARALAHLEHHKS